MKKERNVFIVNGFGTVEVEAKPTLSSTVFEYNVRPPNATVWERKAVLLDVEHKKILNQKLSEGDLVAWQTVALTTIMEHTLTSLKEYGKIKNIVTDDLFHPLAGTTYLTWDKEYRRPGAKFFL